MRRAFRQCLQSGHRVGECGHFISSEPNGIDSLLREFWVVVNNDDARRHRDLGLAPSFIGAAGSAAFEEARLAPISPPVA
jgi:hypothetical protein